MASKKKDTAIIIFTKLPVEGKVKTRLAKSMGNKFAVSFYKVCAEHTFKELGKLKETGSELFLFCPEENEIEQVMQWAGNNFNYNFQQGNDLGLKMYNAFNTVFKRGYKKVIIIGTDAPDVSMKIMQSAISVLNDHSVVIGPANDGGYYLLGFKSKLIDLFSGIEWSTNSVFDNTIEKLNNAKVNYFVLDELIDIDTLEDLQNWLRHYGGDAAHPIKVFLESYSKQIQ
jgi:rSAM/selenodomain-associated transferase 1